jgi:hypothetical protein
LRNGAVETQGEFPMPDSKTDFRRALGAVIEVRGREAGRNIARHHEHQLLGALTKRPK